MKNSKKTSRSSPDRISKDGRDMLALAVEFCAAYESYVSCPVCRGHLNVKDGKPHCSNCDKPISWQDTLIMVVGKCVKDLILRQKPVPKPEAMSASKMFCPFCHARVNPTAPRPMVCGNCMKNIPE